MGNFEIIPANRLFLQMKNPRRTEEKAQKYLGAGGILLILLPTT